jgi:hypothetical protein
MTDLQLYVIAAGQPNTAAVNLTDWLNNVTSVNAQDTITGTYEGVVLRRLAGGSGLVVTTAAGNWYSTGCC